MTPFLDYLDRVHERTRRIVLLIPERGFESSPLRCTTRGGSVDSYRDVTEPVQWRDARIAE